MQILLVDDEVLSREAVADFLEEQLGHQVVQCGNAADALGQFASKTFPLVITDIRMPGIGGLELLRQIKCTNQDRLVDVVIVTGYGDINSAIEALRAGAYDYLQKPVNIEELAIIVERVAEQQQLRCENRQLKSNLSETVAEVTREMQSQLCSIQTAYAEVVGIGNVGLYSPAMQEIAALAEKLHQDRTVPVLIEGETGTGKEIIARLIHYGKGKVTTPFIGLNCSAISSSLFESELFGYEEGAFTGAKKSGSPGKLALAQGGTLFLDEIGDLPLEMQPKLLRVIQQREFYPLGSKNRVELDVRLVGATNCDIEEMVRANRFRQDLFFRLNVGRIRIPPLRERQEDIGSLAQMFLIKAAEQKKRRFRFIAKPALQILEKYDWPGNVRELENTIERVLLLFDDIEIRSEHLQFLSAPDRSLPDPGATQIRPGHLVLPPDHLDLEAVETEIVQKALRMFDSNKSRTAEYLGLTRSALRSRLKKLGEIGC